MSTSSSYDTDNDGKMDCWKDIVSNASIRDGYGQRMLNGSVDEHGGIAVISGDSNYGHGTAVRTLADGVVIESGYNDWNGNYVRINNDDGTQSVYLHLQTRTVASGRVEAGQQIGTMNCTGSCYGNKIKNAVSGTHVHITTYLTHQGNVDPNSEYTDTVDPAEHFGGASCSN